MNFPSVLGFFDFHEDPLILFLIGLGLLGLFIYYFATEITRRKRNAGTILVLGIALLCLDAFSPPKEKLKGGIDISGGSSFTLRVEPGVDDEGQPLPVSNDDIEAAITVLEGRLDPDGAKGMIAGRQGSDRIIIQMPGVSDEEAEAMRETIETTARLEIRQVDETASEEQARAIFFNEEDAELVSGYKAYEYEDFDEPGRKRYALISLRLGLDGSYIAQAFSDPATPTVVNINLTGEGGERMERMTEPMIKGRSQMASILDGRVLQIATLQADSLGKNFTISGLSSREESQALAKALNNPLRNPLVVEEQRQASATLGEATVKQGITAGLIALGLTVLFVLLYYRFAGIIALIGLLINVVILFGAMALLEFSFTLPGIAGIILTIGVAVDANVLIYERLREELNAGKSVAGALQAAFEKAFSAIFDANITTLITALILFWRASGTVKGFAVTLTIGIIASMFAALIAVRVMFWWGTDKGLIKKLSFADILPKRRIDFLGKRKIAFVLSAILLIGSISVFVGKGSDNLGIDFTGGTLISYPIEEGSLTPAEVQVVLDTLETSQGSSAQVESTAEATILSVRTGADDTEIVKPALTAAFPQLVNSEPSVDEVSASLGGEFLRNAAYALGFGLLAILIYLTFRFEFSFALGATVAIFHDLIISVGIILALGHQLELIHVGAILTIAGYSINDTIVVFDRIRETLRTKRGDVKDVMNLAISATLSRTILTSATTFMSVVTLYFLGGSSLQEFSLAIMVGVLVGTYSSIFIAAPFVYLWSKMRGTNLRREVLDADLEAEVINNNA